MNAQEYRERIEALFKRWKGKAPNEEKKIDHPNHAFVRDGVVCPEEWFSQEVRPLFLLKEAYDGDQDWDLVEDQLLCGDQEMGLIWKNITKWTEGLFGTSIDEIPEYVDSIPLYCGNEWLKKIAVVNVKKSDGRSNSKISEIEAYAEYDTEELLEEIALCDPTVIICGFTMKALNIITDGSIKDYNKADDNWVYSATIKFGGTEKEVIVIDFFHPANRYPRLMNFYTLTHLYQLGLRRMKENEKK